MAEPKKSLLSLGSNLGKRKKNLDAAVDKIQQTAGVVAVRVSRYRESKPVGGRKGRVEGNPDGDAPHAAIADIVGIHTCACLAPYPGIPDQDGRIHQQQQTCQPMNL